MSTATRVFRCTEMSSVNIAALDRQHMDLIETIHELEVALRAGEGNGSVNDVLERLVNYADVHFSTEEALMQEHGFPGLSSHRARHDIFRKKIATLIEDFRASKPGVPVSLLLFLQTWLKDHLLKTDKLYSAYLNARGVR